MARSQTCGAAGGAISLWFRLIDCYWGGVVSPMTQTLNGLSTASTVFCMHGQTRFLLITALFMLLCYFTLEFIN